jgi:WD40 repeat protein
MMQNNTEQGMRDPSRRRILQGLAICIGATGIGGCAQFLSQPAVPSISSHRPPGSVLYTYRGHSARVTSVAWSPDGRYLASGSLDTTVQICGISTDDPFHPVIYRGHTAGIQAVTWSPDSQYIASGSLDTTVQVWHARTGKPHAIYHGHTDAVMTVAWSPDGTSIVSGSADGTLRMWDVATSQQKYIYRGHTAVIHSVAWSSNSRSIASGGEDKTVQILQAATGTPMFTYQGHSDTVCSVTWSPDGTYVASGSWDKTVQVWQATNGKIAYTYRGYNVEEAQYDIAKGVLPDLILAVAWSHNGKRIAAVTQVYCGDNCGVVVSWDAYTRRNVSFYIDVPVFAIAWSPDDTRLVTSITVSTQSPTMKETAGPYVQISQA